MELSSLIASKKEINIDFPDMEGFKVTIAFVGKDELRKIGQKCKTIKFNKTSRLPEEAMDDALFSKLYTAKVIVAWEGLKYEFLKELLPIDEAALPAEGELEFTAKNAQDLVSNSSIFDNWLSNILADISNFNKGA